MSHCFAALRLERVLRTMMMAAPGQQMNLQRLRH
jgi:hypothetical protein